MVEFEFGGKRYVFKGCYRRPYPGEYFLSDVGDVFWNERTSQWSKMRAIVEPVKRLYEARGVVVEETGEVVLVWAG
ncbi:hypothetical protein CMI37_03550 [Candidatus Pacearchaeota archaeon]|nr:hypothetical protein [Candidatus Pacearchaeota archaeon]